MPSDGRAGDGLRLLRSAHGVVDAFQQEGQPDAGGEAERQGEGKIPRNVRLGRIGGDPGLIHAADVVGAKSGSDAGFLQFLHQAFVERAIALHVALQQAVLDGALIQLVGFLLLVVQGLAQHGFVLQGSEVAAAHPRNHLRHLGLELGVHFLQLSVQLHHFGIGSPELGAELGHLDLEVGLLLAHFLHQRRTRRTAAGADAGRRGGRVRIAGLHQAIDRFFLHPVGFGGGQFLVQLIQLGGGDVLLFINAENFVLLLVLDQLFLRSLDLHLAGPPVAWTTSRKPAWWTQNGS